MQAVFEEAREKAREAIRRYGLEDVRRAVIHLGHFDNEAEVDRAMRAYEDYLVLRMCFPMNTMAPWANADVVWHEHLTMDVGYMSFCREVFGKYLPHNDLPLGTQRHDQACRTRDFYYELLFGNRVITQSHIRDEPDSECG